MKSVCVLSRLANRETILTLSKNTCAFTSCQFANNAGYSSSCNSLRQQRSITTSRTIDQAMPLTSPALKQNPTGEERFCSASGHIRQLPRNYNVVFSKFDATPTCTTPFHRKILKKILDHAAAYPNRSALIIAENPSRRITYSELHRQTYTLASFLALRGIGHFDVCCTLLPNCLEYVPSYLATMMTGAVNMAIDQNCSTEELENAFRSSHCKVIITNSTYLPKVLTASNSCPSIEVIICVTSSKNEILPEGVIPWTNAIDSPTINHDNFVYNATDPAFIQYHSGVPESQNGIVMSHKNLSTMLDIETEYFSKYVYKRMFYDNKEGKFEPYNEHAILSMPFYNIFGFTYLNRILAEGISGVLMTDFDPTSFLKMIQNYKPKVIPMLPQLATFLLHNPLAEEYDLKSIEVTLMGGAPFTQELVDEFLRKFTHVRFMVPFYGWSECGIGFMSPMKWRNGTAAIMSTFQQKIVCPETGETLPFNTEGEICLRSPTLMQGYLNNPEATAKVIDSDGWFHTGDIGVLDQTGHTLIVRRNEIRSSQLEDSAKVEVVAERRSRRI